MPTGGDACRNLTGKDACPSARARASGGPGSPFRWNCSPSLLAFGDPAAVEHDALDAAHVPNIFQWISVNQDQISDLATVDRTQAVRHSKKPGVQRSRTLDDLHRRQTALDQQ